MGMEINFWDVEHGSCASVLTPNGQMILLDCGHNATTNWRPSTWLNSQRRHLDLLIVSNLDEDHVTDLPNIHRLVPPQLFKTNPFIDADWALRKKKEIGGPRPGVAQALAYMKEYVHTAGPGIDWGLEKTYFFLPTTSFDDFNNLSLVTFLFLGGFGIIFPGDVQREGWEALLRQEAFRNALRRTTIFVASHHGRADGYHEGVFDYCSPSLVLISDKSKMHETQENVVNAYAKHTHGIVFQPAGDTRKVLTTRRDGCMNILVDDSGYFHVTIQ